MAADPGAPSRAPHPALFGILVIPFGVTSGFVSVALSYLATKSGLSVEQGALLIALSLFPQVWKFFWAPIADITLSRRSWYLISVVLCAVLVGCNAAVPLGPKTFVLMEGVVLLASIAATFLGFAVEGMLAHLTPATERGRYSGWYQAGNLGGSGIGGGIGLWLLTHFGAGWVTSLILGGAILACAAVLPWVPPVPRDAIGELVGATVKRVGADLWSVLRTRTGFLTVILCLIPIGTGAASGVMSQAEVAEFWRVSADQVALVQGFVSGLVMMVGCLVGGYGCHRLGSRAGYAWYGAAMAAVALVIALLPATPSVYVAGNLTYAFTTGMCYAGFSAFVLDAIGSTSAATKYNAFASISNTPIWYMGLVLAAVETKSGPRTMLVCEAACAIAGIAIFLGLAAIPARRRVAVA